MTKPETRSAKPLSVLAATHLVFLGVIAAWLGLHQPRAWPALLLLLAAAAGGELVERATPRWSRRLWLREALLVGSAALAWWLAAPPVHAFAGMGLACLLLAPPRGGSLRLLAGLCAADLITIGSAAGRTGAQVPVPPWTAAAFDTALAVAAVAADAWLESRRGGRGLLRGAPRLAWWRWCAWPAAAAVLGGLLMAWALGLAERDPSRLPPVVPNAGRVARARAGSGLQTQLTVGAVQEVTRDTTLCARLAWEVPELASPAPPRPGPVVYLRALALSRLRCDGPYLAWSSDPGDLAETAAPLPPGTPLGVLLRLPGGGDAVMIPDGSAGAVLEPLFGDRDGNLFRPLLGSRPQSYVVSLEGLEADSSPGPAEHASLERWRSLPRELFDQDWEGMLEPRWAIEDPLRAAAGAVARLRERCQYDLSDLPVPQAGPGGALRTFLLDPDPERRRGHCQYFATATTVLLRLSGHAARCVVGFASEEVDAGGACFRALHAHAWVEVLGGDRRWHRVEATSAAGFARRMAGVDPSLAEPPPPVAAPSAPAAASAKPHPLRLPRWWPGAALLALALAVWYGWRLARRPRRPRRLAELERRSDGIIALAAELGVRVGPATTLSVAVAGIAARTGLDLAAPLAAHLRARFGEGPLPPPWPLAALRAAARTRRR
ncbi:MAG: transglutaminase-like domain-containing protein [Planctomycetes bacterium]|nr:transglutaminase-like domain-containing protein [Planctomycetota bacterium]